MDREAFLKKWFDDILKEAFPDTRGVRWTLEKFEHRGDLTYMEVTPDHPARAGYERFRLVHNFAGPKMSGVLVACSVWENGQWVELFSHPEHALETPVSGGLPHRVRPKTAYVHWLVWGITLGLGWAIWGLIDAGVIYSEDFYRFGTGAVLASREQHPLTYWFIIGVMSFITACLAAYGIKLMRGNHPRK